MLYIPIYDGKPISTLIKKSQFYFPFILPPVCAYDSVGIETKKKTTWTTNCIIALLPGWKQNIQWGIVQFDFE